MLFAAIFAALALDHSALDLRHARSSDLQTRGVHYLLQQQLADGSWRIPGNDRFTLAGAACGGLALVQAGLPSEHSAIALVDRLLAHHPPTLVYDAAMRVQFLDALDPPDLRPRLERAAAALLVPRLGYFNYGQPGQDLAGDLSNHQFALIALEVLDRYELGPSKKQWEHLTQQLLEAQTDSASWGYFPASKPSPTMQLAGTACLAACYQALVRNRASSKLVRQTEAAIGRCLTSIEVNWFLDLPRTRAPLNRWTYYGLATLERVMALAPHSELATRNWYEDARHFLAQSQRKDGSWASNRGEPVLNTMLALLTLSRATASTGQAHISASDEIWPQRWTSEGDAPRIVATGLKPCTAFVVLAEEHASEHVQTQWFLDGEPLATSKKHRGATQFVVPGNGDYELRAICTSRHPEEATSSEQEATVDIAATGLLDARIRRSLDHLATTVPMSLAGFAAESSSGVGGSRAAEWAFDGTLGAAWRWSDGDAEPWVGASWEDPAACRGLFLVPYPTSNKAAGSTAPMRLRIWINGKRKKVLFADGIPYSGQYIRFGGRRKLRELRVQIMPYTSEQAAVEGGFSEIQLMTDEPS